MKRIKLTQNKYALLDDSDFQELNNHKWYTIKHGNTFYAVRQSKRINGKQKRIFMHRIIAGTPNGKETDHVDCDGLNNQRRNLRVCTRSENEMNKGLTKLNTSGFKGVSWFKTSKKWGARIYYNGKNKHLGLFKTKLEAYNVYCKASKIYHREFSRI